MVFGCCLLRTNANFPLPKISMNIFFQIGFQEIPEQNSIAPQISKKLNKAEIFHKKITAFFF